MVRSGKSACLGKVFVNSSLNLELVPPSYKYAERNVRNLTLVVTAQECKEVEAINIDEVRALNRPEDTEEYTPIDRPLPTDEENDVQNDNFRHDLAENDAEN